MPKPADNKDQIREHWRVKNDDELVRAYLSSEDYTSEAREVISEMVHERGALNKQQLGLSEIAYLKQLNKLKHLQNESVISVSTPQRMFAHPFSFKGRIRRLEFGLSFVLCLIINTILNNAARSEEIVIADVIALLLLIPQLWFAIAQGVKRCHDLGKSGWWVICPFFNPFGLIFEDGKLGENIYGSNPKGLNFAQYHQMDVAASDGINDELIHDDRYKDTVESKPVVTDENIAKSKPNTIDENTAKVNDPTQAIVTCQNCSQSLCVPNGTKLQVTCPKCNGRFIYDGRYKDTDVAVVNILTVFRYTRKPVNGVVCSYHHNGNVSVEIPYKDGIKDGIARYYYESGIIESETPYKNNVVDGVEKVYYENGELRGETSFKKGKRERNDTDTAPEQFGVTANTISTGLERVRESWFAKCVKAMEGNPDCTVRNRKLGGNADLAIKAFQLLKTVTVIADNQYVSRSDGPFFSDVVFAQVCGNDLERVMAFFNSYVNALNDTTSQITRFSVDVVAYISGKDSPDLTSMLCLALCILNSYITPR